MRRTRGGPGPQEWHASGTFSVTAGEPTLRCMNRLMKALGLVTAGWAIWRLFGPDLQPTYQGVQERPIHVPGRSVFVGHREFFVREAGPAE